MCGRYSLASGPDEIANRFLTTLSISEWQPRYNIAPTQKGLVVVASGGQRRIVSMEFGMIPHWAKEKKSSPSPINAKAETLSQKRFFCNSFAQRRCLVCADGFFEWLHTAKGALPHRISLNSGGMFAFAGLWDRWNDPTGRELHSFAIVTTVANELVKQLHERMPAILLPEEEALWLDTEHVHPEQCQKLLHPYPPERLQLYRVTSRVNSWRYDTEHCIEPLKRG